MFKSRKSRFVSLICALVAAVFVCFALPVYAQGNDLTGNVVVKNLKDGDKVRLYKFIDGNVDGENNLSYTVIEGIEFDLDAYEKAEIEARKAMINACASEIMNKDISAETEAQDGEADFTNLDLGSYLVVVEPNSDNVDEVMTVYQLSTVNVEPGISGNDYISKEESIEVELKKEDVKVTKTHGDGETVTGSYGRGEEVPFVITANTPVYPENSTNKLFTITDTPSENLELNKESIVVTLGEGELSKDKYTLEDTDNGGFKIDISGNKYDDVFGAGQYVEVKYTAKIKADAKFENNGLISTNKVQLTVSSNPWTQGTYTPERETEEYTYGFFFKKIAKQGENNDLKPLQGAKFQLQKFNDELNEFEDYKIDGEDYIQTSNEDGYVIFDGLGAGQYQAVEIEAPAGYQTVKNPIQVFLNKQLAKEKSPISEATCYVDKHEVEDHKIGILPTTGGPGTIALTVAGLCLVAGAANLAIGAKNKENK